MVIYIADQPAYYCSASP